MPVPYVHPFIHLAIYLLYTSNFICVYLDVYECITLSVKVHIKSKNALNDSHTNSPNITKWMPWLPNFCLFEFIYVYNNPPLLDKNALATIVSTAQLLCFSSSCNYCLGRTCHFHNKGRVLLPLYLPIRSTASKVSKARVKPVGCGRANREKIKQVWIVSSTQYSQKFILYPICYRVLEMAKSPRKTFENRYETGHIFHLEPQKLLSL